MTKHMSNELFSCILEQSIFFCKNLKCGYKKLDSVENASFLFKIVKYMKFGRFFTGGLINVLSTVIVRHNGYHLNSILKL